MIKIIPDWQAKIGSGRVAEMLLGLTEFMEEEFDEINTKLRKNTELLEKLAGDLSNIKKHLKLE